MRALLVAEPGAPADGGLVRLPHVGLPGLSGIHAGGTLIVKLGSAITATLKQPTSSATQTLHPCPQRQKR